MVSHLLLFWDCFAHLDINMHNNKESSRVHFVISTFFHFPLLLCLFSLAVFLEFSRHCCCSFIFLPTLTYGVLGTSESTKSSAHYCACGEASDVWWFVFGWTCIAGRGGSLWETTFKDVLKQLLHICEGEKKKRFDGQGFVIHSLKLLTAMMWVYYVPPWWLVFWCHCGPKLGSGEGKSVKAQCQHKQAPE